MFIRSCTRLEKSTDIISEIENYKNISDGMISVLRMNGRWTGTMSGNN